MASEKQARANRLNSEKSTGPTSTSGKTTVSKNSLKHGLLSKETLLPWEDKIEFDSLVERYFENLVPANENESFLVDRIVSLTWRLKRAGRAETGLITSERYNLNSEIETSRISKLDNTTDEIIHLNTLHIIDTFPDLIELSLIFSKNSTSFANLQRYEINLEKSLYKAWHELQRIQAIRKGESNNLPVAIDINTDCRSET